MRIQKIDSYDEFLSLEETWNNILQKSPHSIFSTWEWVSTWLKHFGHNKELIVLVAREQDEIYGIAPLTYSVHRMLGARIGKIEFIGTQEDGRIDSDYNNFLIHKKEEKCIKHFINYLYDIPLKWDSIDLADIPYDSKLLPFMSKRLQSGSTLLLPSYKCVYIPLPKAYHAFLSNLSGNTRRNLRRNQRHLQKKYDFELINYSDKNCIKGMKSFIELHQKRWQKKGLPGVFNDEKNRHFHLEIAREFSKKNRLGLFLLIIANKPAAAIYGFRYASKYYFYLSGFDPKYNKYSIGNLSIMMVIEKCIQEGLLEFDLMRGGEQYKYRLNGQERLNRRAVLFRRGLLANCERWIYNFYWKQANRLKYILLRAN